MAEVAVLRNSRFRTMLAQHRVCDETGESKPYHIYVNPSELRELLDKLTDELEYLEQNGK